MSERLYVPGLSAGEDLSSAAYKVVYLSAAGQVSVCSAAGESKVIGVLQNAPKTGEEATVVGIGYARAMAGGAITAGAPVTATAGGLITTAASGGYVIGRALTAAAGSGNVIDVFLSVAHALVASIG